MGVIILLTYILTFGCSKFPPMTLISDISDNLKRGATTNQIVPNPELESIELLIIFCLVISRSESLKLWRCLVSSYDAVRHLAEEARNKESKDTEAPIGSDVQSLEASFTSSQTQAHLHDPETTETSKVKLSTLSSTHPSPSNQQSHTFSPDHQHTDSSKSHKNPKNNPTPPTPITSTDRPTLFTPNYPFNLLNIWNLLQTRQHTIHEAFLYKASLY
ncbi:hypothetical protein DL98DRAFT_514988 [Cadophora sp. DSE1049]|nr:hypothetical protein DL98DRAFT_514988 [Cadophora sp. DSE1049]